MVLRPTRYDDAIDRLREAARPERAAPPELAPYLEKVRRDAAGVNRSEAALLRSAPLPVGSQSPR